jgi:hypothetical protein
MNFTKNKPLRNQGVYLLHNQPLVLFRRSDVLSFLFSQQNWDFHGPVDYRVSHGYIYCHGRLTMWTDDDLFDTGLTAIAPSRSIHSDGKKSH